MSARKPKSWAALSSTQRFNITSEMQELATGDYGFDPTGGTPAEAIAMTVLDACMERGAEQVAQERASGRFSVRLKMDQPKYMLDPNDPLLKAFVAQIKKSRDNR